MNEKKIIIKKAKENNLKSIDIEIPHNTLTVITGVSGSGKSTLAFDTIYAEGYRRFVESLSAYVRQFLERQNKPDVEVIKGLPPAVAIEQKKFSRNPRSTVGTTTEIYDYIRLLYGKIGTTICKCGRTIEKSSPSSVTKHLIEHFINEKIYILFCISSKVLDFQEELERLKKLGFFRVYHSINNEVIDFDAITSIHKEEIASIYVLVDRLTISNEEDSRTRLSDSIEQAFKVGEGRIYIYNLNQNHIFSFSSFYECPYCEIVYQEPDARLFSFNNPYGACPQCQGFGRTMGVDEELVIPNPNLTLLNGAIHPFRTPAYVKYQTKLLSEATKKHIPVDKPINQFTQEQRDFLWDGSSSFEGINGFFKQLELASYKIQNRLMINRYRGYTKCRACGGSRLRTSARRVFVSGKSIPDLIFLPFNELAKFFNNLQLTEHQIDIVGQVVKEIKLRIQLLLDIGLEYLTLDRMTQTLSGGEAQRINLSSALGSSLVGTVYILDEPSIGMHSVDTKRLLNILHKLKNIGNTVIVVEHDPEIIENAEFLIDMGPGAGEKGGEIVYSGDVKGIFKEKNSVTGQYLSGKKKIPIPDKRLQGDGKKIVLKNPRANNLKIDTVEFPLGCIVSVTGVSGSGKSTLINEVLFNGLAKMHSGYEDYIKNFEKLTGYHYISKVEMIDQSSIGKSSRSTPVTYTGVFDYIRDLFANTQQAKQLGLSSSYFSFNIPGGRCEACEGEGTQVIDMQFLSDVRLECEVCHGTRYKKEARSILFKDKSIVDVLKMTINEAIDFFDGEKKITRRLEVLRDVGLDYLRLGQSSSMLSGGEAQRIKLANQLELTRNSDVLFIFDEPTTGLHLDDILKLMKCFYKLIENGNSVLIIEHNLHVIASSDWIIDLGPGAGEKGGLVVATGTPEDVMKVKESLTGKALIKFFDRWK